ncbi:MAG TPA: serine/threonine-protein kinase, partial [Gemmatimonadaceae bacterium]|nr:serine/threonine-protein kinase [Gemmatimonadaceae bacterium]
MRAELGWMVAQCVSEDSSLDQPAIERFASLFDADLPPVAALPRLIAGRFRLERELGSGGMATVYLAHDLKHSRDVALKMLRPELAELVGAERFLAEIQVTATLRHPHILPLFDSGEADGCIYFVTTYIEGGTLRERLAQERVLPKAEALRIAGQVAEGLASAHEQGIVHRDVKPENILLAPSGHVYVADFGIALAMSRVEVERSNGFWLRVGTPAYMSPEQLAGSADIDARTDIYSLGCVLHEMLVGRPPTRADVQTTPNGRKRAAIVWRRLRQRLLDTRVERIVNHALARSPADRFQSAGDFARELDLAS